LNEHSKMSCEYSVYQYISIWEWEDKMLLPGFSA
jgi:hypothetical protein